MSEEVNRAFGSAGVCDRRLQNPGSLSEGGGGRAGNVVEADFQSPVPEVRRKGALQVVKIIIPRELAEAEHSGNAVDPMHDARD